MNSGIQEKPLKSYLTHYTTLAVIASDITEELGEKEKRKKFEELVQEAEKITKMDLKKEKEKRKSFFVINEKTRKSILALLEQNIWEFFDSISEEAQEKEWEERDKLYTCFSITQNILVFSGLGKITIELEEIFSEKAKKENYDKFLQPIL